MAWDLLTHTNPLSRLMKRWNIARTSRSGGGQVDSVAGWLQPGIQVDRDWGDDDRHVWAYTADHTPSAAALIPAVAIFSVAKEVLIRRIDARCWDASQGFPANAEISIFTPDESYNPVVLNAGQFFPFLQTSPGARNILSVPAHAVVGGEQTGLYQVNIGGVLVNPAIGPRYVQEEAISALGVFAWPRMMTLLDWTDPPLILPPFRVLCVQWINCTQVDQTLFVNLWTSEREVQ